MTKNSYMRYFLIVIVLLVTIFRQTYTMFRLTCSIVLKHYTMILYVLKEHRILDVC